MEGLPQQEFSSPINYNERGFSTSLFGFAREEVVNFINHLVNENTARNSQLNNLLINTQARLKKLEKELSVLETANTELVKENSTFATERAAWQSEKTEQRDKAKVILSQLEEKRSEREFLNGKIDELTAKVDTLNAELSVKQEEIVKLSGTVATYKEQNEAQVAEIKLLKERLEHMSDTQTSAPVAKETAQRTANYEQYQTRIQSAHIIDDFISIKHHIDDVEKQLQTVAQSVNIALSDLGNDQRQNFYRTSEPAVAQPPSGYVYPAQQPTNGGWLSAVVPQQFGGDFATAPNTAPSVATPQPVTYQPQVPVQPTYQPQQPVHPQQPMHPQHQGEMLQYATQGEIVAPPVYTNAPSQQNVPLQQQATNAPQHHAQQPMPAVQQPQQPPMPAQTQMQPPQPQYAAPKNPYPYEPQLLQQSYQPEYWQPRTMPATPQSWQQPTPQPEPQPQVYYHRKAPVVHAVVPPRSSSVNYSHIRKQNSKRTARQPALRVTDK